MFSGGVLRIYQVCTTSGKTSYSTKCQAKQGLGLIDSEEKHLVAFSRCKTGEMTRIETYCD